MGLMIAASAGRLEVVRALIRAGADLERVNNKGGTALGRAVGDNMLEVVQLLLDAGASVDFESQVYSYSCGTSSRYCTMRRYFQRNPEKKELLLLLEAAAS